MQAILKTYGVTIGIAVILALTIRTFVIEAYRVPTNSMRPTLEAGDTVFVAKWTFGLRIPGTNSKLTQGRDPLYGEIVVFTQPDESARASIRRVMGLPGDQIAIGPNGLVLRNKAPLKTTPLGQQRDCVQEYATADSLVPYTICTESPLMEAVAEFQVPADSLLVMGDLRTQWADADHRMRSWQVIPRSELRAKAFRTWVSIEPTVDSSREGPFSRIRFDRMLRRL